MYLVLTSPITREAITDDISSRVAVKAVCLCDGRSTRSARRQRDVVEAVFIRFTRFYRVLASPMIAC
jgi:hypothetical protein